MAEPNISPTINTLRREVGNFLGWGRDFSTWTATQESDFQYIMDRALRMFYYPPISPELPRYEWEFLRTVSSINLVTNTATYDLPDDFGGTMQDNSLAFASGSEKRGLMKMPEEDLRKCQAIETAKGTPLYYSIFPKTFDPTVGQRWQISFYPTPDADENTVAISYRYTRVPDRLTNTNVYPAGGAQYGETLLYAFLAASEAMTDDDAQGMYQQKFQESLAQAIRNDESQKRTENNLEA